MTDAAAPRADETRRPHRRLQLAVTLCVFLVGTAGMSYGLAQGWCLPLTTDAAGYARMTRELWGNVQSRQLETYFLGRLFPCAVVRLMLETASLPLSDLNVAAAFGLLNAAALALGAAALWEVCFLLGVSPRGRLLGCVALFGNVLTTQMFWQVPVATDHLALALILGMFLAYLRGQRLALAVLTGLGAFTWGTLVFQGALLLAFPRTTARVPRAASPLRFVVGAGIVTVLLLGMVRIWMKGLPHVHHYGEVLPPVPLSMAIALAYVFAAVTVALDDARLEDPLALIRSLSVPALAGGGVMFLGLNLVQKAYSVPGTNMYGMLFHAFTQFPLMKPGLFLVSNTVFWGPLYLLTCALWRPVSTAVREAGLALWICLLLTIPFSTHGDPRMIITFVPLILPFTLRHTDRLGWGRAQYLAYGAAYLVLSRALLPPGPGPLSFLLPDYPSLLVAVMAPWMTTGWYFFNMGLSVAALALVAASVRGGRPARAA